MCSAKTQHFNIDLATAFHIFQNKEQAPIIDPHFSSMYVTVRLNGSLGRRLRVERGVRQGSITSPWMFNLVYHELVQRVNELNCGISIGDERFNMFCYADDLLLASTTITGLQCMIDACTDYVQAHGQHCQPSSPKLFQTSTEIPFGPIAYPSCIPLIATSTSFLLIAGVKLSFGTPSPKTILGFSSFSSLPKYPFHRSMILSCSHRTTPCSSLICVICVKSLAYLSRAFAIL